MKNKISSFLLYLILCLLFSSNAQAYIPPYWMIMSRTSDNHGKGVYTVEQDLVLNHGEEPLIIHERWTVQDENNLRLEVTGRGSLQNRIRLTYVYQNNRRYFVDENGARRAEKIPNDFFEPYFHYRLSKNIKPMLVAQKIAPAISLKSDSHRYSEKSPFPPAEPYVRLSRTGGSVSYAIGSPTPVSSSDLYPGIWIEQDQFHVRKLRLPSQFEIRADDFKKYSRGLWYPSTLDLRWGDKSAKIQVKNVNAINSTTQVKTSLQPTSLNYGENPNLSRLFPDDETIRYFYTHMR
ncbi:MAG: hypothetical protein KDD38_03585 [Bdellovibrionales bacterium]|nr:hypothetical protein [Bdellovibrionales bacterium]